MDRRRFLALGAAVAATSACTGAPTLRPAPRRTDPDAAVRTEVAASEEALVAAYRRAIALLPTLADELGVFERQHSEHLEAVAPGSLRSADPTSPSSSAAPASPSDQAPTSSAEGPAPGSNGVGGSAASSASPRPTRTPTPREVLSGLARAEEDAHEQRLRACDAALDPGLARILCLVAASEAQHAAVLTTRADLAGSRS